MGSRVSRSTARTSALSSQQVVCNGTVPLYYAPRSVISANVRLALRWRSILSEKTSVLRARRGSPEKKSVSPRCRIVSDAPVSSWGSVDVRFRDIAGDQPLPPVRCLRGHYHRGHRGISLGVTSAQTGLPRTFSGLSVSHYLGSMLSCKHPWPRGKDECLRVAVGSRNHWVALWAALRLGTTVGDWLALGSPKAALEQ